MDTLSPVTYTLPPCRDRDQQSSCWHMCDIRSVQDFTSYDNETRVLTFAPSHVPYATLYSMFCKIYDTGTPAKMTSAALLITVTLYSPENFKNLLVLAPYISNFTQFGEVTIQMGYPFSTELKKEDINDLLEVWVGVFGGSNKQFTWKCTKMMESSFMIQIRFQDVLDLSEKDFVSIKFKEPEKFYATAQSQVRVKLQKNFKIEMFVPAQQQIEDNEMIGRIGQQTSLGLKSFLYANFGMNLIMAASLQLLWGLINSLQLVVRTPLMGMKFPSNAKSFFSSFVLITNFDILPSQDLNTLFFNFNKVEYQDQFSDLGYDSVNAIDNMGSFLYYMILIISIVMIAHAFRLLGVSISHKKQAKFGNCFQAENLFQESDWGTSLEFYDQTLP
ncbi:hypothetical protein FGO68_gene9769 [Halteria grandinella]|uniref:Uncharacterized protein n=1 Tax=Halteria grandinella TaxID=5974 RepID=A0A8J8T8S8_HALGN|nr:hypothetical protein FGO68_gene9769 [Halteria grandinella]